MVSLKDIATKCGVSVATASKALNDQKDIGEETKLKIKQTAKEMGYFPNSAARALKTNRSYNLGILYKDDAGSGLTHEYFSGVINGIMVQSESLGYDITFINTHQKNREMSYYEHCLYRNFDGIAVVCSDYQDPDINALMNNSQIPVITIDYLHHNCTSVSSDNIKGMEELLTYIIGKGHQKIAYIHGQAYSFVTKERLTSFYRTMEKNKIAVPEEYVREAAYLETKDTAKHTKSLLQLSYPPTCIVYPDDTSLIGGWNVINEAGLKIARDISIAGYDGAIMSQLLHPKLTTMKQDAKNIGKEAAFHLINRIENPRTVLLERFVRKGTLLPGESVGDLNKK